MCERGGRPDDWGYIHMLSHHERPPCPVPGSKRCSHPRSVSTGRNASQEDMGNEASAPAPVPSADEPPILACFGETESEKQAKDRRLMQILGTPPPRRKKGLKQQPGDPKSSAEYFVNEVTFRKKTLGTIFDYYSQGSTELTFDQAKLLVQHLEETDHRGNSEKSAAAGEAPDIADDEMYYILEKLGGEMHASDLRRSTVPRRQFIESMFQAMNLKTYSERHFDRVAIVLSIKGEHAASASVEKGADVVMTKCCLMHIWDAFDWNGDGHMNREEFGAFAIKAFGDGDDLRGNTRQRLKRNFVDLT